MPVKSQKQAKYIYSIRGKYGSKAKTPKKDKWVWDDEWVKGVNIKSLPTEIGEDVKKLNEDRFLKTGFYFSSLSTGDKIKKGSKEYTIVSVGADDAYIKDNNGKQILIKSLNGFEPIKVKALNEDITYPVVFPNNQAATLYYKVEGNKWIIYYEYSEPASEEEPLGNAPVTILVANKKILSERNIKAIIKYIQKVNTPNQQLGDE